MTRFAVNGGQYQPLSISDIHAIHQASIKVLAETGVKVENENARGILANGGAELHGDRVCLPEALVEDALAVVPKEVLLAGRAADGSQDLLLNGKRVHFGTGGSPANVLPAGESRIRPACLADVVRLARLAQALSEVDFFVLPVTPVDIPPEAIAANRFYAALMYLNKHVMGGLISLQGAREVYEMGCLIAGGPQALRERPFISGITSWMVSPLTFDSGVTDILTYWCQQGLPVALSSAPMAGSTAPVTLAGTLVQLNAEQLAGIVYTQLVRRGTPVLAGYIPGQMNLRNGNYLGGTPEDGIMQAAGAQMAQFYGVPVYCSAGMTDAKLPDEQAGYEKMMTLLLTALSGASYIHHAVGMLENMNIVSYEQMILDNDIILLVRRILSGMAVTPDHLAVETIQRVGPGGHYLMDEHTRHYMRQESVMPGLSERNSYEVWQQQGGSDARQRAAARVKTFLAETPVPQIDENTARQVRAMTKIYIEKL